MDMEIESERRSSPPRLDIPPSDQDSSNQDTSPDELSDSDPNQSTGSNPENQSQSDGPIKKTSQPLFKAPSFKVFSQAPSSHGSLDLIQPIGLSNNEIEVLTEAQYYRNLAATVEDLQGAREVPGLPPKAIKLLRKVIEICEQAYDDMANGKKPPLPPNVEVITIQDDTPPPSFRRRSQRSKKDIHSYAGTQATTKRTRLFLQSKPKRKPSTSDEGNAGSDDDAQGSTDHSRGTVGHPGYRQHSHQNDSSKNDHSAATTSVTRASTPPRSISQSPSPGRTPPPPPPSPGLQTPTTRSPAGTPAPTPPKSPPGSLSERHAPPPPSSSALPHAVTKCPKQTRPRSTSPTIVHARRGTSATAHLSARSTSASRAPTDSTQSRDEALAALGLIKKKLGDFTFHTYPKPSDFPSGESCAPTSTLTDHTSQSLPHSQPNPDRTQSNSPQQKSMDIDPQTVQKSNFPVDNRQPRTSQATEAPAPSIDSEDMMDLEIPRFEESSVPTPLIIQTPANSADYLLRHQDVFIESFASSPFHPTAQTYADARDSAFRLIHIRSEQIPALDKGPFCLPPGTYFADSNMKPEAWIVHARGQGVDFFSPSDGELFFSSGIWSKVMFDCEQPERAHEPTWQSYLWRAMRPIACPTPKRAYESLKLFHDAILVGGEEVIHRVDFQDDPQQSPYENSLRFVSHLLETRPRIGYSGLLEPSSRSPTTATERTVVKAATLTKLQNFAINVHDVLMGVAVLDLYAKLPRTANTKEQQEIKKSLKKKITELKAAGFSWACLAAFLISGVRGLIFTSRDHRVIPVGSVKAIMKAAEDIHKRDQIVVKESIWCRTNDYIMNLLIKGYSVSSKLDQTQNTQFGEVYVQKIQLAVCMAYDIGYYWTVKVPGISCALLPKAYIPDLRLPAMAPSLLEEEDMQID
ncbi:hypothetical protein DFH28DRAFT_1137907 [Melampsora americana]|nr:hypothetical protein DFH28DRAFT_1137907 [Melampsora americana]